MTPPVDDDLSYLDISFLTFQATVEVIIICLAGFLAAIYGYLSPQAQKNISLLNVNLFTPCLIFSKLAPSLSLQKILDIFVIPIFFSLSTLISLSCSKFVSKLMKLNTAEGNYVSAMAVFGNSNSLPVSLTLALSYTLPDLDWEDLNGHDSPDLIASRGILYLLIFQQLGQVLRWSWGYNTLLRKRTYLELIEGHSLDEIDQESNLQSVLEPVPTIEEEEQLQRNELTLPGEENSSSSASAKTSSPNSGDGSSVNTIINAPPLPSPSPSPSSLSAAASSSSSSQRNKFKKYFHKFISAMNPPLYSMLASVVVASTPFLHRQFYEANGFVQNTVALAIKQMGSVSIPLILVVLGSNLAPSREMPPASARYTKLVTASLISRMILPPFFLLPLIAICVKFLPISVLDDPIFLIVAFILTISPPAIQLSQICQLNEIYQKEMAGVLFWGYVVLTLPTTILIVVASLEVLKHV